MGNVSQKIRLILKGIFSNFGNLNVSYFIIFIKLFEISIEARFEKHEVEEFKNSIESLERLRRQISLNDRIQEK